MAESRLLLWLLLLPTLWGPSAGESPASLTPIPRGHLRLGLSPGSGPGVSLVWVLSSL